MEGERKMAYIVPWDIPALGFRFLKRQLNAFCDGQQRLLLAGRDFPRGMAFEDVRHRLKKAAQVRDTTVHVWPDGEGNVNILMMPKGSGRD
jgi:hypothetical protein